MSPRQSNCLADLQSEAGKKLSVKQKQVLALCIQSRGLAMRDCKTRSERTGRKGTLRSLRKLKMLDSSNRVLEAGYMAFGMDHEARQARARMILTALMVARENWPAKLRELCGGMRPTQEDGSPLILDDAQCSSLATNSRAPGHFVRDIFGPKAGDSE